jgi:excinuclease ABC subunit A
MVRLGFTEMIEKVKKEFKDKTILIGFQKKLGKVAADNKVWLEEMLRTGYSRYLLEGKVVRIEDVLNGKVPINKSIEIIVDRIKISLDEEESTWSRVKEALQTSMKMGNGWARYFKEEKDEYVFVNEFTTQSSCPKCGMTAQPKGAISFSFNSPLGACTECKGFGNILTVDEEKVVPNPKASLLQGAIDPFMKPSLSRWQKKMLQYCKENKIDASLPYEDLSETQRKAIFDGNSKFKGVRGVFKMLDADKYKIQTRVFISRYQSAFLCQKCKGSRLSEEALKVRIADKSISDISEMTIEKALSFLKKLPLTKTEKEIGRDILKQLDRRLDTLNQVGLSYLTLSRLTKSLSGGEYQRILLATQLSQGLTDTLYVLDEPSIGLHPKDTHRLIEVLKRLKDLGNSLVIVEHDPEIIEWGEYVVDMGPGSGVRGGDVVFAGSRERFLLSETLTGDAVRHWREECKKGLSKNVPDEKTKWLEVKGAEGNNLKKIDVAIPLEKLVTITGVSGSGKSTLIVDTLYPALSKMFNSDNQKIEKFKSLKGFENISAVELVDQSPIGKSSRSNPITFVKGYDEIRALFSATPEAQRQGLTPGHFSFSPDVRWSMSKDSY